MFYLLGIKVKKLLQWMPLMKISLGLLQLINLFICSVQDEVIFFALHISALERPYLISLYSIHRFIGMIFRNE